MLLPGWWSITLAYPFNPDFARAFTLFVLFGVGAVIMRGAGCVINDLWDRDFDGQVERTRTRPLVAGTVTPRQALLFAAFLSLLGLMILLCTNKTTILLGLASIPFIVFYPLMKRITWWPQAFLGLTFNFGALMGWAAMTDNIALPAILLYIAGFFWTLGYDTIYAHMDSDDDALIGVKSTARLFGKTHSRKIIAAFYAVSAALLVVAIYPVVPHTGSLIALIPAALGFAWQIKRLDPHDPALCLRLFKSNRTQGFLVLLAVLIGVYITG